MHQNAWSTFTKKRCLSWEHPHLVLPASVSALSTGSKPAERILKNWISTHSIVMCTQIAAFLWYLWKSNCCLSLLEQKLSLFFIYHSSTSDLLLIFPPSGITLPHCMTPSIALLSTLPINSSPVMEAAGRTGGLWSHRFVPHELILHIYLCQRESMKNIESKFT